MLGNVCEELFRGRGWLQIHRKGGGGWVKKIPAPTPSPPHPHAHTILNGTACIGTFYNPPPTIQSWFHNRPATLKLYRKFMTLPPTIWTDITYLMLNFKKSCLLYYKFIINWNCQYMSEFLLFKSDNKQKNLVYCLYIVRHLLFPPPPPSNIPIFN